MHSKRLILAVAATLLVTGSAFAQQRDNNRPDRRNRDRRPDLPREIMDEIRKDADANKDGELDAGERQKLRETIRLKTEEREIQMLAKYDADGDGELSWTERKTAREAERKAAEEKQKQDYEALFTQLDTNEDGSISKEEWLAGREKATNELGEDYGQAEAMDREREMEQRRDEFVKRYDKDGDGKLNEAERRTAREAMRDRWRQQRDQRNRRDQPPMPENEGGEVEL